MKEVEGRLIPTFNLEQDERLQTDDGRFLKYPCTFSLQIPTNREPGKPFTATIELETDDKDGTPETFEITLKSLEEIHDKVLAPVYAPRTGDVDCSEPVTANFFE